MGVKTVNQSKKNIHEMEENCDFNTDMNYHHVYVWKRIAIYATLQIGAFIGLYMAIFHARLATIIWGIFIARISNYVGVVLGAHRHYTHKGFKATTPLKIIFIILQTMAGQNSILNWAKIHRQHHKYSDTDADPHNSNRGFFFCHMGWLLSKRHPLVIEKRKFIDVSDLLADKIIMFQYKYFVHLYFILAVVFPVSVPIYFWNETLWSSFFVAYCMQYVTQLHLTWCINSVCHLWGPKPFDKRIKPTQASSFFFVCNSEVWHNYHHVFPWDCHISEYGKKGGNVSRLLDTFAYLGMAYDLKTASPRVVYEHMKKYGDQTNNYISFQDEYPEIQEILEETSEIYDEAKIKPLKENP